MMLQNALVITVAFFKSFENGRLVYFRELQNGSTRARNNFVSGNNDKVPNKGTKVLPWGP